MLQKNNIKIINDCENLEINILHFNDQNIEYEVKNTTIAEFDQHSRARLGVKFYEYNVSSEPVYVFYSHVYKMLELTEEFKQKTFDTLGALEILRNNSIFKDSYNLMSRCCSYKVKQDYNSLKGQMGRRLKFCEESSIVGVHWLLRHKMIKAGITIAEEFLPGCDKLEFCDYSQSDHLSQMFGCLFKNCGRWPDEANYASFNESCTTREELEKQLGISIPMSQHEKQFINLR